MYLISFTMHTELTFVLTSDMSASSKLVMLYSGDTRTRVRLVL